MNLYTVETNDKIINFTGVSYYFEETSNTWHFIGSWNDDVDDELVVKDSQLQHFQVFDLPETPSADVPA